VQHIILVLNTDDAVSHFAGRGLNMALTLQAALGPHQAGRCVEGGLRVSVPPLGSSPPRLVASYVYGEVGGLFLGAGLQAGMVAPRDWENAAYYEAQGVLSADILRGKVGLAQPTPEVQELHRMLARAENAHAHWDSLSPPGIMEPGEAGGSSPKRLGPDAEAGEFQLFVPGRLCLFGEHSDWAGGLRGPGRPHVPPGATLVVGLSGEGLFARARRRKGLLSLRSVLDHGEVVGPIEIRMEPDALAAVASAGGFWSYAAGVALRVLQLGYAVDGLEIDNYKTTLPVGKGLSSSAALCVLVSRAFSRAYGLGLSVRGEMELAYQGERATPSACGRMDQACAYGPRPVLLRHDGDTLDVEELPIGAPFHWVIADLNSEKCTTTILKALQAAFEQPPETAPEAHRAVQELLGATNLDITSRAVDCLARGDVQTLGLLMVEAQAEFDAAGAAVCPEQLTAPALHAVLAHEGLRACTYGGKGVGSQGDGTVQFLCMGEGGQEQAFAILTGELGLFALKHSVAASPQPTSMAAAGSLASLAAAVGTPQFVLGAPGAWLAAQREEARAQLVAAKARLKHCIDGGADEEGSADPPP